MQPDSEKSISLPDIQIYAAGLMGWHPLLNSTSSWIHMKRTFSSSSAADAVTVSRNLYEKAMDSFSFTKGWSLEVSAGPVQKRRRWRSHRNNTGIRSRKCIPGISCKTLCKTEKIKNLFAVIVQGGLEVIHSWTLLHSFNHGVLTG